MTIKNPHPLQNPTVVSSRPEALHALWQLPKDDAVLEFDCHHRRDLIYHIVTVRYNSVDITNLVALVIDAQIHYGGLTADVRDIEDKLRECGVVWLQSVVIMV